MPAAAIAPNAARHISAVREFNRFYTARLGLLGKRHLDGEFSLTEARILYEIAVNPQITASSLRATLQLDAGYISRLLASLTRRKLMRQTASRADGREKLLSLSAAGVRAVARLNVQSDIQISEMLLGVSASDREALVASLARVRTILGAREPAVTVVRVTSPGHDALEILHEYYEAVHVVQRDSPAAIGKILAEPGSSLWLAYLGQQVVGCVMLRKLASIPHAGECKRLYVKPAVRGRHIAAMLLDAQEGYARSQGLNWLYLDTYHDLKVAIALYKRRGYERCSRYNDNPQATLFMRKRLTPRW
jgi:DNA-binding MarR family transcriptional regulator/GNAT superfamily N-acetyltransferase